MRPLLALAALLAGCAHAQPAEPADCRLVIAGGALDRENQPVWSAFTEAARATGDIVIVPAASGYPSGSADSVRETLVHHGWPGERVHILPLAVVNDPDTMLTDESSWADNAEAPGTVAALESAAAIWFTGGDQARIAELFGTVDAPRLALKATRRACAGGTAIGGTSAGAAIMSDPMLLGGDSLPALLGETDPDAGALQAGGGLGFFAHGVVDQHFGERAREGRLIAALMDLPQARRIGFGIDENTAMVVQPNGTLSVEGAGQITVIDARGARLARSETGVLIADGLVVHVLSAGDSYDLESGRIDPARWRDATVGNEYFDTPPPSGAGIALPRPRLAELLGEGLLDNSARDTLSRLTFDEVGQGLVFRFSQLPQSQGYWGRDQSDRGAYTLANIRLDIRPIYLRIEDTE